MGLGRLDRAEAELSAALSALGAEAAGFEAAHVLGGLARLSERRGQRQQARQCYREAVSLYESVGRSESAEAVGAKPRLDALQPPEAEDSPPGSRAGSVRGRPVRGRRVVAYGPDDPYGGRVERGRVQARHQPDVRDRGPDRPGEHRPSRLADQQPWPAPEPQPAARAPVHGPHQGAGVAVGEFGGVPGGVLVRRARLGRVLRHQDIRQQRHRVRGREPDAQVPVDDPQRAVGVQQGGSGPADSALRGVLGEPYGRRGQRAYPQGS
ncbi:hypothetical protein ABZ574_23155 [Streptomyces anulatus]